MAAGDVPFFSGVNSKIRFFYDGKELIVNAKTWSAKANATKGADDVGGEDRSRPWRQMNFWEFSFAGYQRDLDLFDAFLDDIANDDSGAAPKEKSIGIQITPVGGRRRAYLATELVMDDPEQNMGGRTERQMLSGGFRARYFKPVKSAA